VDNIEELAFVVDEEQQTSTKSVAGMSAVYQSLSPVFDVDLRTGLVDERHRHTARMILLHAGVWLPLEVYELWPVLFPWMKRDNPKVYAGHKFEADPADGFEIQDNSPIGTLKKDRPVQWTTLSPVFQTNPISSGAHEWMQSHCWDGMTTSPLTNSFVPNLVWLPHGLGRLTDDTSSLFDQEARRIAWSLYRDAPVPAALTGIIEGIWASLAPPEGELLSSDERELVNFFAIGSNFHLRRQREHLDHGHVATRLINGDSLQGLKLPKKYRRTLQRASSEVLESLARHMEPFAEAARLAEIPTPPAPPSKTKGTALGSQSKAYRLLTPTGEKAWTARSRAALGTISAVIETGVSPAALHQILPARFLATVPGRLSGADLEAALSTSGVKGVPERWFIDSPIHSSDTTSVVSKQAWFEEDEPRLQSICDLTNGAIRLIMSVAPMTDLSVS
jgi:hypothetical protein